MATILNDHFPYKAAHVTMMIPGSVHPCSGTKCSASSVSLRPKREAQQAMPQNLS